MVLTLARRALGSHSEAEDVGQEVFYRVYRKVKTLREPDSFRNFVHTCAVRALQTELHRKKMRSWLSFERPDLLDCEDFETLDVESRDLLRKFYDLLERLPPRDRMAFVLRRVESMSVEEIAAAMETSESTVKRSLARASSRLSRWMDDEPRLPDGERRGR
jgi:RNA polymerase sigma-70 factor (ECF subfamily)